MAKTYKNLYPSICDFDNLLGAYRRARQEKKQTPEMYAFHFNLEENLWDLHQELLAEIYQPGAYRHFHIYEPKRRKVSAASWHAVCCRAVRRQGERPEPLKESNQPLSPVGGNPGQRYPPPVPASRPVPIVGARGTL